MVTESLVSIEKKSLSVLLKDIFTQVREDQGIVIDHFVITPSYEGMVTDRFDLLVSAPSLSNQSSYQKVSRLMDLLHERLANQDFRRVNTVRVFDTKRQLRHSIADSTSFEFEVIAKEELIKVD